MKFYDYAKWKQGLIDEDKRLGVYPVERTERALRELFEMFVKYQDANDKQSEEIKSLSEQLKAYHMSWDTLEAENKRLSNIITHDVNTMMRIAEIIQTDKAVTSTLWYDDYCTVVDTLSAMIQAKQALAEQPQKGQDNEHTR